ncbi:MAG: histidine--tRNA ligase [Patescibacteria group bacterium]
MSKLPTEPYKGVRDFYPEDQATQNYIFGRMRGTAESFGYTEFSASILEPVELYRGKTSEEIVNEQMYVFKDKGDREVALRPEMTPSVARMVAARRRDLGFPLRWYSIPNVFRYERPQKGRLREHWQLNCDIFGVSGIEAEVEIITLAYRIMKSFGAKDEDFEIRLNNRELIKKHLEDALVSEEKYGEAMQLLDKREKMSKENFNSAWGEISDKPMQDIGESESIKNLLQALRKNGVPNCRYESSLVRGFDYYTGTVFEVFDTNPENKRSLFGGGRYDNLLELFGEEKIPAVGFGMGDVTMKDFLQTRGLLPPYTSSTHVLLASLPDADQDFVNKLADELRHKGVNVATDFTGKKAGDIIKTADKQKTAYIIFIGSREMEAGTFTMKHLPTGREQVATRTELPTLILNSTVEG